MNNEQLKKITMYSWAIVFILAIAVTINSIKLNKYETAQQKCENWKKEYSNNSLFYVCCLQCNIKNNNDCNWNVVAMSCFCHNDTDQMPEFRGEPIYVINDTNKTIGAAGIRKNPFNDSIKFSIRNLW